MSTSANVGQSSQASPQTQSPQSATVEAPSQSSRQKLDPSWDHCTLVVEGKKKALL